MSKEFEVFRLLVIREAKEVNDAALGFAFSRRVYPFFSSADFVSKFADDFAINYDTVKAIVEYFDEKWMNKEPVSFYKAEDDLCDQPGGRNATTGVNRHSLISVLRYAFLSDRFDKVFWDQINLNGTQPAEAHGITSKPQDWDFSIY